MGHRFTHAVTIKMRNRETLHAFQQHPAHLESMKALGPLLAEFIAVDFQLEAGSTSMAKAPR